MKLWKNNNSEQKACSSSSSECNSHPHQKNFSYACIWLQVGGTQWELQQWQWWNQQQLQQQHWHEVLLEGGKVHSYFAHTVRHVTHTWRLRSSGGSDTEWLSIGIHRWITSSRRQSWRGRQFTPYQTQIWCWRGEYIKQCCVMGILVLNWQSHIIRTVKYSLTASLTGT